MKTALAILFLAASATVATAFPVMPLAKEDSGLTVQVRKGGSSRSAVSGRFVTRGHASRNPRTTVTHGKY